MDASMHPVPLATLLIVDDDPLMTDLFRQSLTRRGFQVLIANTGLEALQLVQNEPEIRLVITDMLMPGMDGLAVANAILLAAPDLPVVLSTGSIFDISTMPSNVVDIVQKPLQPRALADRAQQIIDSGLKPPRLDP